jgi:hypothetical protein
MFEQTLSLHAFLFPLLVRAIETFFAVFFLAIHTITLGASLILLLLLLVQHLIKVFSVY